MKYRSQPRKKTASTKKKLNCWEYMDCGREPGGKKAKKLCCCPAAVVSALPDGEYNDGEKLGRRCWRMAGTLCDNKIQGTFAQKLEDCRSCCFYLKVKEEEGDDFVE